MIDPATGLDRQDQLLGMYNGLCSENKQLKARVEVAESVICQVRTRIDEVAGEHAGELHSILDVCLGGTS